MSERKTVFITGSSRGIGHATATYFVKRGWRAITCSRDERHEHITVDLELTHELPGTVERLHNILGGQQLHALVNNAGYSPKGEGGSRLGCVDSLHLRLICVAATSRICGRRWKAVGPKAYVSRPGISRGTVGDGGVRTAMLLSYFPE